MLAGMKENKTAGEEGSRSKVISKKMLQE